MGSIRRWVARQIERGRLLGRGTYGLLHTIAAAPARAGRVRNVEDRDGDVGGAGAPGSAPPLDPPEAEVPFQHRSEWEPGRRRGFETDRARLKKEKGQ